jgi:hypothetical protein
MNVLWLNVIHTLLSSLYLENHKKTIYVAKTEKTHSSGANQNSKGSALHLNLRLSKYQSRNNKLILLLSFLQVYLIRSADNENNLACKVCIGSYISSKGEFTFFLPPPWTDINYVLPYLIYPYAIKSKIFLIEITY